MRKRAEAVRARAVVRRWHYRQRHLAAGVWGRLRRVLADASEAYVIADEEARRLIAEGHGPEPCGYEIDPPKILLFLDRRVLSGVPSRRPIRVGLTPEFIAASAVALIRFESEG